MASVKLPKLLPAVGWVLSIVKGLAVTKGELVVVSEMLSTAAELLPPKLSLLHEKISRKVFALLQLPMSEAGRGKVTF